jgi:hypothetical protein
MSEIADRVTPGSVVLFNESFAATNEREGSEIARQIVRALVESGVRVGGSIPQGGSKRLRLTLGRYGVLWLQRRGRDVPHRPG